MNLKHIFGPVPSRRLGSSLGIDIVPSKTCTLDCVYCEVGRTNRLGIERESFYPPEGVIDEFASEYPALKEHLDVVTITGSGEPTMNSDLGTLASKIKSVSDHPLAILTNSTLITRCDVRSDLKNFDIIVPSIDAASQDVFERVNRPHPDLDIHEINEALIAFTNSFSGRILLEVLLVKGVNDSEDELKRIASVISRCRYDMVQLNTVFRPPSYSETEGLGEKELVEAMLMFKEQGIRIEPVGNFIRRLGGSVSDSPSEKIMNLLRMRPCTTGDIASVFGIEESVAESCVNGLLHKDLVEESIFKEERFYFGK
ncbi:radical SAM protein [Limisalsivibrio acetivorans]|uniref:radical SAM protein n=1 Tax=Limisalsivibrio acetivorans TaxID=1304888 RepID=UPI0003B48C53|nr:radical SAM protein [Limisalsivibrio acetivorans]